MLETDSAYCLIARFLPHFMDYQSSFGLDSIQSVCSGPSSGLYYLSHFEKSRIGPFIDWYVYDAHCTKMHN